MVENSAPAHIAWPAPYGNIDESTDEGSRSIRLRSPVTAAQVSTSSLRKARTIDAVSPTRISSKVLFSIISITRTAHWQVDMDAAGGGRDRRAVEFCSKFALSANRHFGEGSAGRSRSFRRRG